MTPEITIPRTVTVKRYRSKSEEEGSEDLMGQAGIFTLDDAEETGVQERNEPELQTQRDSRTAPRPTPTPVPGLPVECEMAQRIPDVTYYYPMADIITMGGSYVIGMITNDPRGVSIQTRMVLDQGNLVNPGIVVSEEFFLRLELGYADQTKLKLRTASEGSELLTLGWTEAFTLKIIGITSQFNCQAAVA